MTLLPTTVLGSYPQPAWLVDHAMVAFGKLQVLSAGAAIARRELEGMTS